MIGSNKTCVNDPYRVICITEVADNNGELARMAKYEMFHSLNVKQFRAKQDVLMGLISHSLKLSQVHRFCSFVDDCLERQRC